MPKRFIEPNWKALRRLPDDLQRAWFYMWDKCDAAGVFHYDPDYMMLDLKLKEEIPIESLELCPECQKLSGGRILIKNFILVNYKQLSKKQNAHLAAFRDIEKNKLFLNSGLNEASTRAEEEDQEEELEKEEEGEKGGLGENFSSSSASYQARLEVAPYVNALKRGWNNYHKSKGLITQTWGKYDDEDLGSIAKRIIEVAKEKMIIPDAELMENTMFLLLQEIHKNKFMREHVTPQLMDKKFNGLINKLQTKHDTTVTTPFD